MYVLLSISSRFSETQKKIYTEKSVSFECSGDPRRALREFPVAASVEGWGAQRTRRKDGGGGHALGQGRQGQDAGREGRGAQAYAGL
jgi:hypothetical protein